MSGGERELKDQRVVTMMSPSELDAIDVWSFQNRIRSRGEAIRRLCQIGLLVAERRGEIEQTVKDFHASLLAIDLKNLNLPQGTTYQDAFDRLLVSWEQMMHSVNSSMPLITEVTQILKTIDKASDEVEIADVLKELESLKSAVERLKRPENHG